MIAQYIDAAMSRAKYERVSSERAYFAKIENRAEVDVILYAVQINNQQSTIKS